MEIKQALVAAAKELGASAVGVSSATVDLFLVKRMTEAIERGDLATWQYDHAYVRASCDPQTLLPDARSVISIALSYAQISPSMPRGHGRVSTYAFAADYHQVMRGILQALLERLTLLAPHARAVAGCDTKPLAEKAFAVRSGLGWLGKHTNVIVPRVGSFVFLGEIVTDLELEPDVPLKTHCGSCRLCVVQCPTGALRGDSSIDATRCISDLTQRRDAIPRFLRPLMGEWIWGCDICQEACPPVVRAPRKGLDVFIPPANPYPNLLELLAMPPAVWRKRYAESAMGWRGATVLRRNAAVALGNVRDRASVPTLLQVLSRDRSALVRGHVAWALGRIGSPLCLEGLYTARLREDDGMVSEEISLAIDDILNETLVHTSMEDS